MTPRRIRFAALPLLLALLMWLPRHAHAFSRIAHRGFSAAHRENTLQAMHAAWEAGADTVELDVRILSDNTLVLFHDDSIAGEKIWSLSYARLQALTPAYHVPTLTEAFEACPSARALLLDLKDSADRFIPHLLPILKADRFARTIVALQSRHLGVLAKLSAALEQPALLYVTSLDRRGPLQTAPDPDALAKLVVKNGLAGVSAKGRRFIDYRFVRAFTDRGLAFYVWTINERDRMRHYRDLGVGGIITDHPNVLRDVTERADVAPRP